MVCHTSSSLASKVIKYLNMSFFAINKVLRKHLHSNHFCKARRKTHQREHVFLQPIDSEFQKIMFQVTHSYILCRTWSYEDVVSRIN